MEETLLEVLRCPQNGQRLHIEEPQLRDGHVFSGWLVTKDCANRYPIKQFIPRFVPEDNYANNFGMQWKIFRQTQLDSFSGHPISADRFWRATGWNPLDIKGEWVLDAGCGAGRFAEVALAAGARVVALDYSTAVDACYANLKDQPNLHVVQGDIYALPFQKAFFPFVYSLGVLQHTPDVAKAFAALPPMLAQGGQICTDYYWKRIRTMLHIKYFLRPITKRMRQEALFKLLKIVVPFLLVVSQTMGKCPAAGKFLKRLIPVADYTGIFPLSAQQLKEWALLDTFDMLAPAYDKPQTSQIVRKWFQDAGLANVEVLHAGHLVGRGRKSL